MRTIVRGATARRWLLVVLVAAVLGAVPTVLAGLPVRTAALSTTQLRAKITGSTGQPYTGYARSRGTLGLPSLPDLGDVASLLSGTTDVRAWYASATRNRVDVITTLGERDVYTTPDGEYTWDYGTDLLTEVVGPEPIRLPRAGDLLPPDLARRVLTLDTGDPVTGLPPRRIAGIDAAGLRLRPTDPATTVGEVDIWADPATGLPLRVDITARGTTKTTLTSQFVDVEESAPDAASLTPPVTGAGGVSRTSAPDVLGALGNLGRFPLPAQLAGYARQPAINGLPGVARYGTGLATFVVLPLPANIGSSAIDIATKGGAVKVSVTRGRAVLIGIPMLTVLLEQVGFGRRTYLVAGLVSPAVVRQAATELSQLRRPGGFRR